MVKKSNADIWTREALLCAIQRVPGGIGYAAQLTKSVEQQYINARSDERLTRIEEDLTGFQKEVRSLVENSVVESMKQFRDTLDGPTLTNLIREFKSIDQAGYKTALIEGLFSDSPHYDELIRSPQNYGVLLEHDKEIEEGHFPIILSIDGTDRIMSVAPAALSTILSHTAAPSKSGVVSSESIFAIRVEQKRLDVAQNRSRVIEVTRKTIESAVFQGSMQTPILVHFRADWCQPCKTLNTILEKLNDEYQGAFVLANIDTETEQELAAQLGIRSLPTVRLVIDGGTVGEFCSALSVSEVRRFLDEHIK